ncbi:MAG: SCO family protein [Kiloniellales bacterium]|nr:SCO family protein [Kiloniellales bacterium]
MSRRAPLSSILLAGALLLSPCGPVAAHDGVEHKTPEEAAAHAAATRSEATQSEASQAKARGGPPLPEAALPFPIEIEAAFDLVDQTGIRRSEVDFAGRPMLIFFGYASCEAICSVALPRLAAALDILGEKAGALQPIMITVDPVNDTPEALAEAMPKIHPRLLGLTGTEAELAAARAAFQVEAEKLHEMIDGTPIYSHGSFIYLLDGDAKVLTVLPPILGEDRIAELILKYI